MRYAARLLSIGSEWSASDWLALGTKDCREKRSQSMNIISNVPRMLELRKGTYISLPGGQRGMPCNTVYDATTYIGVGSCFPMVTRLARDGFRSHRSSSSLTCSMDCLHPPHLKRQKANWLTIRPGWAGVEGNCDVLPYWVKEYCYLIAYHFGRRTSLKA